jgi:hypothetical protein
MSCDNSATSFTLVGVLRHWKEASFSKRQNVMLIVRSQYRYYLISKILQLSNVPTKYILSCVHISFKINIIPDTNNSYPPPPKGPPVPSRWAPHSLGTSYLHTDLQFVSSKTSVLKYGISVFFIRNQFLVNLSGYYKSQYAIIEGCKKLHNEKLHSL